MRNVAVVMECTRLDDRWGTEKWEAVGVLEDVDELPGTSRVLYDSPTRKQILFAGFKVELHRSLAEGYGFNLVSPQPRVFVRWEEVEGGDGAGSEIRPVQLTLSFYEAAGWMDGGARVDGVPLPQHWHRQIGEFVDLHYKPEPHKKRGRNK